MTPTPIGNPKARRFFHQNQRGQALAIAPSAFQPQAVSEDLLTAKDLQKRFGLSHVNAVYRLVREYDLPWVSLGGRTYRFRPSEVAAWLASQRKDRQQPARLVIGVGGR